MMTNLPADLSPETAAWMHAQIAISTARAVAPLREELDKVDDWAGGLFVVFLNVLPHLLRTQPELAQRIWKAIETVRNSPAYKKQERQAMELMPD